MGITFRVVTMALVFLLGPAVRGGEKPEVRVFGVPREWQSSYAAPVWVQVENGGAEMEVATKSGDLCTTRRVSLGSASGRMIELPRYSRQSGILTWRQGRDGGEARLAPHALSGNNGSDKPSYLCINSFLLRELELLKGAGHFGMAGMAAELLPEMWQSYAGMDNIIVLDAGDAKTLTRRQREAMRLWVRWLGGRVWFMGAGAPDVAREFGFGGPDDFTEESQGTLCRTFMNGRVWVREKAEAIALATRDGERSLDILRPFYNRGGHAHRRWLINGLEGTPIGFIIGCLALLGIVLGPLNAHIARRHGNMLLFYLLTPLTAGLGTLAILAGALLIEGKAVGNRAAILLRHAGAEAMLLDMTGVRSGIYVSPLRFPGETFVLLMSGGMDDDLNLDFGDAVTATGGWVKPRFATSYVQARPLHCRMNVTARWDGNECHVENGLGRALDWVVVRQDDGREAWAAEVPAGARVKLNTNRVPPEVKEAVKWGRTIGEYGAAPIMAEAAGLPYLDDGGLGAGMRETRFFYASWVLEPAVESGDGHGE